MKMKQYHQKIISYIILLSLTFISAKQKTNPDPNILYQQGVKYLQEEEYDKAEKQFKTILKNDKHNAWAHFGLGLVAEKQNPINVIAHRHFKDAIQADSSLIPAWFGLMQYYERRGKNKQFIKTSASYITTFQDHQDVFHQFQDKIFWDSKEKLGERLVSDLINTYPARYEFHLTLAQIYMNQQKYQQSLDYLKTFTSQIMREHLCKWNYLQAVNYFGLEIDSLGEHYYSKALQSITDSLDLYLFYRDLCYIMSSKEYEELDSLPISDAGLFYQHFWISRDPTLSTRFNERLGEHYRRLAYARKNYRRYLVDAWFQEFDDKWIRRRYAYWYILQEPSRLAGDELVEKYQTKALPEDRELDDMGLIYVRHGKPDNSVFQIPAGDQNMSWHYYGGSYHPEMIFHFHKGGGLRGWIISDLPKYYVNRYELGPEYALLDPFAMGISKTEPLQAYSTKIELMVKNEKVLREQLSRISYKLTEKSLENFPGFSTMNPHTNFHWGLSRESSDFRFNNEPLNFSISMLEFKGKDGTTQLEFFYAIDGKKSGIKSAHENSPLQFDTFLGVYNDQWYEIVKDKKLVSIPLEKSARQWLKGAIIANEQIQLPPGNCHLEFKLHETNTNKLGMHKGVVQVTDFDQQELMMSDVILAYPILPEEGNKTFKIRNITYKPHLFSAYKQGEVIGLYFEVYNLLYDEDGSTQFEISYVLQPQKESGFLKNLVFGKQGRIILSHDYKSQEKDEYIFYNLDTRNLRSGNYNLIIQAKDLTSEQVINQVMPIRLI